MYYQRQRLKVLTDGIFSLWRNWAISMGSICALIALAPVISAKAVPLLAVAFELLLIAMSHHNRRKNNASCFRLIYVTEVILFCSALLLCAVYLYIWQYAGIELTGQKANPDNPQIPILVVAPISAIVAVVNLAKGIKSNYCFNCMRNNKNKADRSFLDHIYFKESKYDLKLLLVVSLIISVVTWGYYFLYYNNLSISDSDKYFLVIFPLSIYIISLVYLGMRYYGMWQHLKSSGVIRKLIEQAGTTVRYLHISGDKILLKVPNPQNVAINPDGILFDVPLKVVIPYRDKVTEHEAITYFRDQSEYKADVRPLYESHDTNLYQNLFHYAVYIDPDDQEEVADKTEGQWFSLREINTLHRNGVLSPDLWSELHRIYTVTMAAKTYDKDGRRLYPIRHYRPTFHLRDMLKSKVDYNDSNWIYVSQINQDKKFYQLRRLWNKLMTGNT